MRAKLPIEPFENRNLFGKSMQMDFQLEGWLQAAPKEVFGKLLFVLSCDELAELALWMPEKRDFFALENHFPTMARKGYTKVSWCRLFFI